MKYNWRLLLACGLVLGVAGCESPPPPHVVTMTGDPVTDGEAMLAITPEKDKLLTQCETAAIAMDRGRFPEAKQLLDSAIARIGGIYGRDKTAQQARSYFHAESKKTFIGEPYERVMAYYYRGILYWMDGEPDNARACFRSGEIMDSAADEQDYGSDYVLLDYLDALATAKLGGDPKDTVKRAAEHAKGHPLPPLDPKANVLIFIEFGVGPVKYADGRYREQLRFAPGSSPVHSATLHVEAFSEDIAGYDDLFFQATTRGGRAMDYVLEGKAHFKEGTAIGGEAAIITGAILAENRHTEVAGLAVLGAGILTELVSAATKAAADTRRWDNLPRYLSFAPLKMQPGQHVMTVEFKDRAGFAIPILTKTITFTVPNTADKVLFVSDKSASPLTL